MYIALMPTLVLWEGGNLYGENKKIIKLSSTEIVIFEAKRYAKIITGFSKDKL